MEPSKKELESWMQWVYKRESIVTKLANGELERAKKFEQDGDITRAVLSLHHSERLEEERKVITGLFYFLKGIHNDLN